MSLLDLASLWFQRRRNINPIEKLRGSINQSSGHAPSLAVILDRVLDNVPDGTAKVDALKELGFGLLHRPKTEYGNLFEACARQLLPKQRPNGSELVQQHDIDIAAGADKELNQAYQNIGSPTTPADRTLSKAVDLFNMIQVEKLEYCFKCRSYNELADKMINLEHRFGKKTDYSFDFWVREDQRLHGWKPVAKRQKIEDSTVLVGYIENPGLARFYIVLALCDPEGESPVAFDLHVPEIKPCCTQECSPLRDHLNQTEKLRGVVDGIWHPPAPHEEHVLKVPLNNSYFTSKSNPAYLVLNTPMTS